MSDEEEREETVTLAEFLEVIESFPDEKIYKKNAMMTEDDPYYDLYDSEEDEVCWNRMQWVWYSVSSLTDPIDIETISNVVQ